MLRTSRPRTDIASNIIIRSSFIYYVSITAPFFFNNDLNFENDLYIIKYVMIMIMIMSRIILRENVENNNDQPYPVNDLTVIIPTFVSRSCYYSLVKPIQSFVPHYSTNSPLLYRLPPPVKRLQPFFAGYSHPRLRSSLTITIAISCVPESTFFFSITIGTFCPTMSYQPLAMSTTDDLDVESASNNHHSKATWKYWFKYSLIEVAVFVICCGISFVVGRQQNESTTRNQVPSSCKDQFFPSTDQFADTLIKVRFVGNQAGQRLVQWNMSFSNPSAHRGEPGPTVDAVWEDAEKCEQFYYCLLSQASPSAVGLRVDTNTILITS